MTAIGRGMRMGPERETPPCPVSTRLPSSPVQRPHSCLRLQAPHCFSSRCVCAGMGKRYISREMKLAYQIAGVPFHIGDGKGRLMGLRAEL